MEDGYVLDFTNATFENFIRDSLGIEINDAKYFLNSSSKANRLRKLFKIESNDNVCKLLEDFHDYIYYNLLPNELSNVRESMETKLEKLKEIIKGMKQESRCENIDYLQLTTDPTKTFKLFEDIKSNINNNNPDLVLDRLHTLMIINFQYLCQKHEILYSGDEKLDWLFKQYMIKLKAKHYIQSEMTQTILTSNISILAKYHYTRNNESYAHANEILNMEESLLIVNNIANICRFIYDLERNIFQS